VRASRGVLNAAGDALTGADNVTSRWQLDVLGNWSGDAGQQASYHLFADADGDGTFDSGDDATVSADHHDTNAADEIESLSRTDDVGSNSVTEFVYDAAGNLVFDGRQFYTYDVFNRLASVAQPGTLDIGSTGLLEGEPGLKIVEFEYDALGRRVRTQRWPDTPGELGWKSTTEHVYGSGADVLEEYDITTNAAGEEVATLARWYIHGDSFPDPLALIDLTQAGDEPAGTPELLTYLKDALGSIGALVNAAGEIVERYEYSPYGQTAVLDAAGHRRVGFAPLTGAYWHDHDLDGDIDIADADHLEWCYGRSSLQCLFAHDRNADGLVFLDDGAMFAEFT
ncbi:MAG: hypothetical protein AB1716_26840, partial [Planctomycetota bacterium]